MKKILKLSKSDAHRTQLVKGISGSAGIHVVNIILTLVSGVLLARILGPDSYGTYAFVISVITIMSLPTNAGLPTLLVREVARNQHDREWGLIRGLLKIVNGFVICYSIFTAVAAGLFSWWVWEERDTETVSAFLFALWLLPLLGFEAVRTGTLRGFDWVVSSQLPEKIVKPTVMIALLGLALLYEKKITSLIAIHFAVIGATVAFLLGVLLLIKLMPKEVSLTKPRYKIRHWTNSLVPLTVFSGLNLLDSQISIIFLGVLGAPEDVGHLRVAATAAALVAFGLIAVNMALAPQVARLYKAGKLAELQRLITFTLRIVAVLSFPIACVFIIWGTEIISFVFGPQYAPAATALAILCIGQLVNTSCGSVALIVNMTGNERVAVRVASFSVILNALLALLLIPKYGLIGAAIGNTVSMSVWNISLMIFLRKKTGIKSYALI